MKEKYKKFDPEFDYCTGAWDMLLGVYFGKGCYLHDLAYSKMKPSGITRKEADKNLKEYIYNKFKQKGKEKEGKIVSTIYYWGVRIFGIFYWRKW